MNSNKKNIVPIVPNVQGTNGTNGTNEYRFILEKGSKKFICPNCNKKTFVRYIDTETNKYLPEQFGRCDRESKCSYHLNPYLEGYNKTVLEPKKYYSYTDTFKQKGYNPQPIQQPTPDPVYFDIDTFKQTLQPERYEQNTFIQNLFYRVKFPFDIDEVTKVIQLYGLGTVTKGYRTGANTFPFIDINGKIRAIQVKQFDEQNHTTGTDFLHSIIEKHLIQNNKPIPDWLAAYTKQELKVSCLFGEHLLRDYKENPIALVEAPKTAIYGALYFGLPQTPETLIWLAVYNKSSLNFDKMKVLKGRLVFVFPDLSKNGETFKEWETKTKEFEKQFPGTRFIFSKLLEQLAPETDKINGYDIGDYLIKQDWKEFRKNKINDPEPIPQPHREQIQKGTPQIGVFRVHKKEYSENWDKEIKALESYFSEVTIPDYSFKLNSFSTITNCKNFIDKHLSVVKSNNGNNTYFPYLLRLNELKNVLSINTLVKTDIQYL